MIKIYHNPRCKTSRAGLNYLESKTDKFEVVKYLKEPFTEEGLKALIKKTGKHPLDFLRKQEDAYKKELKGKNLTDDQVIAAMVHNPKLIHRPIVENGDHAVLAQPPKEIDKIL